MMSTGSTGTRLEIVASNGYAEGLWAPSPARDRLIVRRSAVQYMKLDDRYVVLSQTARKWWRNIRTRPHVELLVAGTVVPAQATIVKSHAATELLAACLAGNPRVAKFYGLRPNSAGEFDAAHVEPLLERVVVIDISPDT